MTYESRDEKGHTPAERRIERNMMGEEGGKSLLYQKEQNLYGGNQPHV